MANNNKNNPIGASIKNIIKFIGIFALVGVIKK